MKVKFLVGDIFIGVTALAGLATAGNAQASTGFTAERGYDWQFRVDETERGRPAILAYEKADTDDQQLTFSCEEGGARIFAGITGGPAHLRMIGLKSGSQFLQVSGTVEETEIPEMPVFSSSEIAGDSLFMKAFSVNGWLTATIAGRAVPMRGTQRGGKAVANFVAHCNAP